MTAYYNEIDPYAAQWLRNLIDAGHIAPGDVDERSIEDVKPDELMGYTQCHFFAGIGIWSLALRNAGWADDKQVWTASCPCQPFSSAGQRKGFADERHLWPSLYHLVGQCRPETIIGEQVSSKRGLEWFDTVSVDLEIQGYAVGAVDTCAAGFSGFHLRQRLYWVAHSGSQGLQKREGVPGVHEIKAQAKAREAVISDSRMGDSNSNGCETRSEAAETMGYGNPVNSTGRDVEWIEFIDGKQRPIKSGLKLLVDAYPGRVEQVRAYGNSLDAEQATNFVKCFLGAI